MKWDETTEMRKLTVTLPSHADLSEQEVREALLELLENEEEDDDMTESNDSVREFERGYGK